MIWLHHWWVNIGLNNDLVSSGNKPLPWPMFSKICMSLSRSQRVNIFTDSRWTDWFFSHSLHGIKLNFQKTKIFGSTSIIHPSDMKVSSTLVRGLCCQGYSFALVTPGGACLAAVFCWSCRETVCHYKRLAGHLAIVVASATHGSQWHKTMLGQSHYGIDSYKGRHKQRNRSKRFPIYRLRRLTRLHRNRRRHTQ